MLNSTLHPLRQDFVFTPTTTFPFNPITDNSGGKQMANCYERRVLWPLHADDLEPTKKKRCETVVFVIVGSYGRENRELLTIERSPIKWRAARRYRALYYAQSGTVPRELELQIGEKFYCKRIEIFRCERNMPFNRFTRHLALFCDLFEQEGKTMLETRRNSEPFFVLGPVPPSGRRT